MHSVRRVLKMPPEMHEPPEWFWRVLDSTRPDLQRLEAWLETASKEQVEQFAHAFEIAAAAVCDFWDGPEVDGVVYSEDDTEDLCKWVVGQGRDLWKSVVDGDRTLANVARLKSEEADDGSTRSS